MPNIEAIVRQINKYLVPQFEKKLRAYLAEQDRDGRIEQIVRLTLDAHSLDEMAWSSLSAWSTILRLIKNFSTVVWKKLSKAHWFPDQLFTKLKRFPLDGCTSAGV